MTPEYPLELEHECLAVFPLEGATVVTQAADPPTVTALDASSHSPEPCQVAAEKAACDSDCSLALESSPAETLPGLNPIGLDSTSEISTVQPVAQPAVVADSTSFEVLIELVMEAADSVRELMTPCLTAHGLNDARFTIMRAIRGGKNGECSQSELARCLKQSEANVSTLLDRMRGDGLVSREKSPFDRRRSVVRLTEKGEQQLTLTEQDYLTRAQGVLKAFDVFEIQAFRDQLCSFIAIWETELEHTASNNAVAGRIGGSESDSNSDGTETRHAQAG